MQNLSVMIKRQFAMQKKTFIKIFRLLLIGFMGFGVGKLMGVILPKSGPLLPLVGLTLGAKLLLFASILPAILFVLAWHEAGHALAGVMVGFDFKMYVVGPFLWEKQAGKWVFKWNKKVNAAGGMVICLPQSEDNIATKFAWYAAAGPIASLLLAVLAAVIGFYVLPPFDQIGSLAVGAIKFFLFVVALFSALIFLVTSIPMHMGGFYSDGARVMRLLSGGDKAKFDVFILKMTAKLASKTRPKDLAIKEIEEARILGARLKEPFAVYLDGYLHHAAFDSGQYDEAERYLQDYIAQAEKIPQGIREVVWLDAAFFYAYAQKDIEKAVEYLGRFRPSAIIPKAYQYAAEAAVAHLKNDRETFTLKKDAALRELPNMMDQGLAAATRERMEQLQ